MYYRITMRQVPQAIERRLSFVAGSGTLEGFTFQGTYFIKSFATIIATVADGEVIWLTDKWYSMTTSRHLNLVRRGLGEVIKQQTATDPLALV